MAKVATPRHRTCAECYQCHSEWVTCRNATSDRAWSFTALSRRLRACGDQRCGRFCKRRASAAPGRTPTDERSTSKARRCAQSHKDQSQAGIEPACLWRGCGVNLLRKINITDCCMSQPQSVAKAPLVRLRHATAVMSCAPSPCGARPALVGRWPI
jgi:hypothetical protein